MSDLITYAVKLEATYLKLKQKMIRERNMFKGVIQNMSHNLGVKYTLPRRGSIDKLEYTLQQQECDSNKERSIVVEVEAKEENKGGDGLINMNNIDYLIKQQSVYTNKQKEFFKRKNLQVEIDEYATQMQVVTSPNKQTKFILQITNSSPKEVGKALQNQLMIEILELNECRLKTVPNEIMCMSRLRVLKLEGNFIKIAPILEVEELSLKNNLLLFYKAGERVRILNLSMNKLQEFTLGSKIEELSLVANEFTLLPKLPHGIRKLELDWFKYTEPPLEQLQSQPLINLLTYHSVSCIDFLNMFSQMTLKNKIIEAALSQDLGVLSCLAANMDINIEDENGDTALSLSLKTDNLFAVRHLIELGASIEMGSFSQGSILSFALESNLPTIVNLIFPKLTYASFGQDIYGNTPLHYLCKFDYEDVSGKILIKAKSLNVQMNSNVHGQTPIHLAISRCKYSFQISQELITIIDVEVLQNRFR